MKIESTSTVPVDPIRIESTGEGTVAIAQGSATRSREIESPRKSLQKETRSAEEVQKDLDVINNQLKATDSALQFTIDEKSKEVIVRIVDSNTGEVIRQIPPESIVKLKQSLANMTGLIIGKKV